MLRLIKITNHRTVVVDVPSDGGQGEEYDIWSPHERWGARLSWRRSGVRIDVGPYRLDAKPVGQPNALLFRGVETGPYGDHEFDVVGVTTDLNHLSTFLGRSHLVFSHGTSAGPKHGGASDLHVASSIRPGAGGSAAHLSSHGILGGRNEHFLLESCPDAEHPQADVKVKVDGGYGRGSYVWDETDCWRLDTDLVGFRSNERIVLQTFERHDAQNGAGLTGRPGRLTVR